VAVADTIKDGAAEAVRQLRMLGLEVALLTGDNRRTARAIGHQAGIDRMIAEVRPEDKASEVQRLQSDGQMVAMVGDGINDAPALAQAGKATMRAIKRNLFWAFIYNLLLIPLAVLGIIVRIFAAAAMALSSVTVVSNSLRLSRFRRRGVSSA
jgi:cation transport ATPase